MSPDICSPFDKNRKGMMLGEGAGILILESEESAVRRKADVYAEVLGYGLSCDAHHITIPNRRGIKKAMLKAMKNSEITTRDVDYISAHGTGTGANDKEESGSIKEIFGPKRVPVSSIKSMLSHCMGAASAIEAITCCLVINYGIIPPTINYKTPDTECDIDCVPNVARKARVNIALNNGFAFGGNNCCVTFSRCC
jgi:3-oxoacyl-[acyl-carrier-protein] synthase II